MYFYHSSTRKTLYRSDNDDIDDDGSDSDWKPPSEPDPDDDELVESEPHTEDDEMVYMINEHKHELNDHDSDDDDLDDEDTICRDVECSHIFTRKVTKSATTKTEKKRNSTGCTIASTVAPSVIC